MPPRFVHIDGPGNERLVRDTHSMGVINTNGNAYHAAQERHKTATKRLAEEQEQKSMVVGLQLQVNEIRTDIQEVKDLLAILINRLR